MKKKAIQLKKIVFSHKLYDKNIYITWDCNQKIFFFNRVIVRIFLKLSSHLYIEIF